MTERGGGPSTMSLRYNSMFWNGIIWNNGGSGGGVISPPNNESYWSIAVDSGAEPIGNAFPVNVRTDSCGPGWYGSIQEYATWEIVDSRGTYHQFQLATTFTQNCSSATGVPEYPNGYGTQSATGQATDGSGYFLSVHNGNAAVVYSPDGSLYGVTPNGNQAYINSTLQGPGAPGSGTDALPGMDAGCFRNSSSVAQPYAPQTSQICHLTYRPLNGAQTSLIAYTLTFAYVPVCTGFYSGLDTTHQAYDYCGGIWALQSVAMPDGVSTYSFTYDTGTTPGHYGQLLSMTLPTGGIVSYSYYAPTGAGTSYQSDFRGDINSVTDYGGMTGFARTFCAKTGYCAVPFITATITPPRHAPDPSQPGSTVQDENVYTTSTTTSGGTFSSMLTEQDYLNGVLVTTKALDTTRIGTPAFNQTTWNQTGATDRIQYQYTTGDVVSRADEYINGAVYRSTVKQYQQDTSTIPYVSQFHMVDYPILTKILDGSGNLVAQESRVYDEYGASYCNVAPPGLSAIPTLTNITGAIGHDDVNFGSTRWARGNPTTITKSTSATTFVTTHICYDTLGNVTQTIDANGHPTRFGYVDNYLDTSCISTAAKTYALPTLITDALGHQTKLAYNSCLREPVQKQDANDLANLRLGVQWTYDTAGRPLCATYPDGGQTCSSYPSATVVQASQLTSGTTWHSVRTTLNSFAKVGSVVDTSTGTEIDTAYDGSGSVNSVSNPYPSGGSGASIVTTYGYDGFGRTVAILAPDGSKRQVNYTGQNVDSYDENGVHHLLKYDAIGRLISTIELGTAATPLNLETDYSYDFLNRLTQVDQWGGTPQSSGDRVRQFSYDWLSRLKSTANPESGFTCFGTSSGSPTPTNCSVNGYDANGNLVTKTDARGIVTTYHYDTLNRVTNQQSAGGTNVAGVNYLYTYDSTTPAVTNGIGRLVSTANGNGESERYGYDSIGRMNAESIYLPSTSTTASLVSAGYDLAGNMTDLTFPDGRHITQTWDSGGRLSASRLADINGIAPASPQVYAQSITYLPDNNPSVLTLGDAVIQTTTENNRLQIQGLTISSPTNSHSGQLAYCYYVNCATSGTGNNGNILSIVDGLNAANTQAFTYDSLNRIATFSLGGTLNQQYSIDSFGNLSGVAGGKATTLFSPGTNRISNLPCASSVLAFDFAGNQLCSTDSTGTITQYQYDAEDRVSQIATLNNATPFETYIYAADGGRARKSNAGGNYTEYVRFGDMSLSERDQSGVWTDHIYANGKQIASTAASDVRLHLSGVSPSGAASSNQASGTLNFPYTIKTGDGLTFRMYSHNATAKLSIYFTDGTTLPASGSACGVDQTGQCLSGETVSNAWVNRIVNIGAIANGKTISRIMLNNGPTAPAGQFDLMIADFVIISLNGTVTPLIGDLPSVACTAAGTTGMTSLSCVSERVTSLSDFAGVPQTTRYYLSDHLGTAQLELTSGGWPVWRGHFSPFGQEIDTLATSNNYKFTGKERDSESNLDYFGARYYASSMGRFSSPDPSGLFYADPTNPQSFNLYAYVLNNPLRNIDPTGLDCVYLSDNSQSIEEIDTDGDTSESECGKTGGTHVDGHLTGYGSSDPDGTINQFASTPYGGHSNQLQGLLNLETSNYYARMIAQQPAQLSLTGKQLIQDIAKDTADLPSICGFGVAAYGGNRVAAGVSADTQGGAQFASGANIATVPFAAGFGTKANYTISGGAAGNVSYQGYALGGAAGVEVGTRNGDPNAIQSVSLVGSIPGTSAPHNLAIYANIGSMGDSTCGGPNW